MLSVKVSIIELSVVLEIGVAKIAFEDQSYIIKIARIPSMLRIGKLPVRST